MLKANSKALDLIMADFVYVDKENASQVLLASRPQQSTTTRGIGTCRNYIVIKHLNTLYLLVLPKMIVET